MLCFFASSGYLKCQRTLISTAPILRDKIICSIVALPVRPLYISFERRKDSRLILLYKGLKGKARIPTDDLIPKNRRCRNKHSLAFQIPSTSKEAYKSSFHRLSGTGMTSQIHLSPLLKCLMTVLCPSLLHSCVQGTNFSPIRTPW